MPIGVAFDDRGNLFISDVAGDAVRRVDAGTGIITTIAGGRKVREEGGGPISTGDGGPAVEATFAEVGWLTWEPPHFLWVVDMYTYRRIDLLTGRIDAPMQASMLDFHLVVPGDGWVYHSSFDTHAIYRTSIGGRTEVLLSGAEYQLRGGNAKRLYFTEFGGDTLYEFDLDTRRVTYLVGQGFTDAGLDGQAPWHTGFWGLFTAREDRGGNLILADAETHRVRRWDRRTGNTTTIAGDGYQQWPRARGDGRFWGDGGPATIASMWQVYDVAIAPDGSVAIADAGNKRVRRVSVEPAAATTSPQHLARLGRGFNLLSVPPHPSSSRPVRAGEVARLTGSPFVVRTVIRDGTARFETFIPHLASSDFEIAATHTVGIVCGAARVIDLTHHACLRPGDMVTVAGTGHQGFSGDGGPAATAEFSWPYGIELDSHGRLLVADHGNRRLRRIDFASGNIETVAGDGRDGAVYCQRPPSGSYLCGMLSPDGAPAFQTVLSRPLTVYVDLQDNLYLYDDGLARVLRIDGKTGISTTVADLTGTLDGGNRSIPLQAELMTVSPSGQLHFWDPSSQLLARPGSRPNQLFRAANSYLGSVTDSAEPTEPEMITEVWAMQWAEPSKLLLYGRTVLEADLTTKAVRATERHYVNPWLRRVRVLADRSLLTSGGSLMQVHRVLPDGPTIHLAGDGYGYPDDGRYAGDGGPATRASLNQAGDAVMDADGNVFIADTGNHVIRMIIGPKGPPAFLAGR